MYCWTYWGQIRPPVDVTVDCYAVRMKETMCWLPGHRGFSLGSGLAPVCSTLVRHPCNCHQRRYCRSGHSFMRNVGFELLH